MARILIGLPQLVGKLENYAGKYDLVEVAPIDQPLPQGRKLRAWRKRVPPAFTFTVKLPDAVATFGADYEAALTTALDAAKNLEAAAIVLCTPPSIRPTRKNRDRVAALRERLPADGVVVAWEARGMWEPEDFIETAYDAGLLPVFDAAQDPLPPGPIAYTRLRAMGITMAIGQDRVSQVAEQLADRREAYVVVERPIAGRLRAGLQRAMDQQVTRRAVPMIFKPSADLLADDEEQ